MATIRNLRLTASTIPVRTRTIHEPLDGPEFLNNRLGRFGAHYDTSNDSHLYKFLLALCGESGAGALHKGTLYARLQSMLESTHFTDLDRLYGDPIGLPRISSELYSADPRNEALNQATWQEIRAKDAAYRARCLTWMRAIIAGPTPIGIALAAEAACGLECDVYERYRHLENQDSDEPLAFASYGATNSPNEFVIIPRAPSITQEERRRIVRLVDLLRPVNSLPTVTSGDWLRTETMVMDVASTSDYFYVRRLVTGRSDINWPTPDAGRGLWITTEEREAPTFAFIQRQETITYPTVRTISASSEHQGMFNLTQRSLFEHLRSDRNDYFFAGLKALASAPVPVTISSPWVQGMANHDVWMVNSYYPIDYFIDGNLPVTPPTPPLFWASAEKLAPTSDTLTLDLGRTRPVNALDLEVALKPFDTSIEYDDNGTWRNLEPRTDFEPALSVTYVPVTHPWYRLSYRSQLVETRYVRLTFTRRDEPWPTTGTTPFPWSIEVRNLRLMHIVAALTDFAQDEGDDILGNTFRTELEQFDVLNVLDMEEDTFWQSQPNPTPHAVEALYFDLRPDLLAGTQGALDTFRQEELEGRSQAEIETLRTEYAIIDEIYIDPITFGPDVHIYYSDDDVADWDAKLWVPIGRQYTLKRGFLPLPRTIKTKFVKIEFSRLVPAPYDAIDNIEMPPVRYRRYPSWVQSYFTMVAPRLPEAVEFVNLDPLRFGFERADDRYDVIFENERTVPTVEEANAEIRDFITELSQSTATTPEHEAQAEIESRIQFYSPHKWQDDLLDTLNLDRALSRFVRTGESSWTVEAPVPTYEQPQRQSQDDLTAERRERFTPTMFFPIRCRHGYQVMEAERIGKIAYFVAIKEVQFYRRDYKTAYDEKLYEETFADDAYVSVNEFEQNDWRFEVTP